MNQNKLDIEIMKNLTILIHSYNLKKLYRWFILQFCKSSNLDSFQYIEKSTNMIHSIYL